MLDIIFTLADMLCLVIRCSGTDTVERNCVCSEKQDEKLPPTLCQLVVNLTGCLSVCVPATLAVNLRSTCPELKDIRSLSHLTMLCGYSHAH